MAVQLITFAIDKLSTWKLEWFIMHQEEPSVKNICSNINVPKVLPLVKLIRNQNFPKFQILNKITNKKSHKLTLLLDLLLLKTSDLFL
jgi:hypothetical protein